MTYERFLRLGDQVHAEWVDGEVVPMAAVSNAHSQIQVFLLTLIQTYAEAKDLGVVRCEPFQMRLGPSLGRSPDVLFVARAHLDRLKEMYLDGSADLVIEVVSPECQTRDRLHKFAECQRAGVPEYWLVDPDRGGAEFYLLGDDGLYHAAALDAGGVYHSRVLEGLWLNPAWLGQRPLPKLLDIVKQWGLG